MTESLKRERRKSAAAWYETVAREQFGEEKAQAATASWVDPRLDNGLVALVDVAALEREVAGER